MILDLLCEALHRIGLSYKPKEGESAKQALDKAPRHIQELVTRLENVANVEQKDGPGEAPHVDVSPIGFTFTLSMGSPPRGRPK